MKRLLTGLLALCAVLAIGAPSAGAQAATARIHLIHGIPNTPVDVVVGGQVAFGGFAFGETKDLSSFAGQTLAGLKVNLAGTSTTAIDAGNTAMPASGNHTVIAHLDASGNPTLSVFENDTTTLPAGKGRLTVRHTAAAPAVDVRANGDVAFAGVTNPNGASLDLAVGTVSATVVPAGATTPVVIGPADLAIQDGTSLIVYAVGSLSANSLTVLTESIGGLGTAPTLVNTGNSPVESGSGAGSLVVLAGLAGAAVLLGSVPAVRVLRARTR
ncbi:MAG: DUF4397 domain-containing protein [Acidimicrobiia bacterium]